MPDIEALRDFFNRVNMRLDEMQKPGPAQREHFKPASAVLKSAVTATRKYLLALRNGKPRKPDEEASLSFLWRGAGEVFRIHDPAFADVCELKGMYWSDPHLWTVGEIQAARIELDRMERALNAMVRND